MQDVVILVVKAIAGGGLVVLFALISEVVQPKLFSGLRRRLRRNAAGATRACRSAVCMAR
jgi:hypothetical protein